MAKLELFLLGSPQIYVNGQEITDFNTRKDRALLSYLAVTGTAHSRETLAGLLWSELPEDKARRNLRHTLSHLQRVIGPQWLTTERGVALTQDQPWLVDVRTLRSSVKNLAIRQSTDAQPTDTQEMGVLNQVLNLYRGEFLQGFYIHHAEHFEEWVLAQREEARLLTLRGLEALVERALAQSAYAVGLAATHRLLQLEPWSEPAHRLQMRLLMQSGYRTDALAQYEKCREILAAELGVEPMPETTTLYQQIQKGHYTGPVVHRRPPLPVSPSLAPSLVNAPLAVRPSVPNNLSRPLSAFVGRSQELTYLCQRLTDMTCRLLTIIGPGGMGKTSLAEEVGQRILQANQTAFSDGIYFVALAGLELGKNHEGNDVDKGGQAVSLLATTIAERIGCDLQSGLPPQIQLQNYLRKRRLLLILDNFEHLLAATATVLTLLTQAPALTMLITSRARLNVRGETVLTLDKLSLPSAAALADAQTHGALISQAELGQTSEAVAMFVQRAQCLDPHFTLNATNFDPVVRICHLVDGLPLGIELATSMLPMLSCTALAEELTQSLAFLRAEMSDLPEEQRTLRAVFEHSWRLLTPPDQTLLAKLSIFPATFHWAAAKAIADASPPLLLRLINQSLVNTMPDGCYAMHPSVRAFALEKLGQTPEQGEALRVHFAHFYLDFLAQKEPALKGADLATVTAQIYTELDNIRLAWRWAVSYELHTALLASMHALFYFYELHGLFGEAFEQAESSLQQFLSNGEAQSKPDEPPINLLIGRLQTYLGYVNLRLGCVAQAESAFAASLARLQQEDSPFATILCLTVWGSGMRGRDIQQAKTLLNEAVRQVDAIDDDWLNALANLYLGEINHLLGNYAEATAQYSKGYVVSKQSDCAWSLAQSQRLLGRLQLALGHFQSAETHLHNCIAYAHRQNMKAVWVEAGTHLGEAHRLQGRLDEAQHYYGDSRQQAEALHHRFLIAQVIWYQGCLAEQRGEYATAQALFAESMTTGHPNLWTHLPPTLGWALIGLGELEEAYRYFCKVVTEAQTLHFLPISLDAQVGVAYIQRLGARYGTPESQAWVEKNRNVLYDIYQNPAATAETRQRIDKIVDEFGLRPIEKAMPPTILEWAELTPIISRSSDPFRNW